MQAEGACRATDHDPVLLDRPQRLDIRFSVQAGDVELDLVHADQRVGRQAQGGDDQDEGRVNVFPVRWADAGGNGPRDP